MLKKWLFLFLFLSPLVSFSQDQTILAPYIPKGIDGQAQAFEVKVKHEESKFKVSGDFQRLLIYLVTREDDLSLCKGNKECLELASKDLLPMRYLAEGRCDEIKYEVWGEKEICKAVKTSTCSALSDWKGGFCQGLINEDSNMLLAAGATAGFRRRTGQKLSEGEASGILSFYSGFKHYSTLPCERFVKNDPMLPVQLSCEVLFSPSGTETVDSMVRDIAFFNISKDEGNPDVCNLIKNSIIKKNCLNKKVKELQDIW